MKQWEGYCPRWEGWNRCQSLGHKTWSDMDLLWIMTNKLRPNSKQSDNVNWNGQSPIQLLLTADSLSVDVVSHFLILFPINSSMWSWTTGLWIVSTLFPLCIKHSPGKLLYSTRPTSILMLFFRWSPCSDFPSDSGAPDGGGAGAAER